jgi:hypothetical protein
VSLTSALPGGATQTARFWAGSFTVGQGRGGSGQVQIGMPKATGCPRPGAQEQAKKTRRQPSLWAQDDHGRYRTNGSNSQATVRGTRWRTVERCDGTLTTVAQGVVVVRDLRAKRSVRLSAGHSYLARVLK